MFLVNTQVLDPALAFTWQFFQQGPKWISPHFVDAGTSSVLVAALFKPLLEQLGYSRQQRQQLVQGLLGTHAHEMTSMIQQLLFRYDEEAGRRCGMKVI